MTHETDEIIALIAAVHPLMAGHKPEVQGAALADLLALWIAGHICLAGTGDEWMLREALLKTHLDGVRKLIPVNLGMLRDRLAQERPQ